MLNFIQIGLIKHIAIETIDQNEGFCLKDTSDLRNNLSMLIKVIILLNFSPLHINYIETIAGIKNLQGYRILNKAFLLVFFPHCPWEHRTSTRAFHSTLFSALCLAECHYCLVQLMQTRNWSPNGLWSCNSSTSLEIPLLCPGWRCCLGVFLEQSYPTFLSLLYIH